MTDVGVLLGGAVSNRSVILERMKEVIAFEQDIAKVVRQHLHHLDVVPTVARKSCNQTVVDSVFPLSFMAPYMQSRWS